MRLNELAPGTPAHRAELQACQRWRAQQCAHEQAWQRMVDVWGQFEVPPDPALPPAQARLALQAGQAAGQGAARQQARRLPARQLGKPLGLVAVLMTLAGWIALQTEAPALWLADASARAGERRVLALPDLSELTLDGGSAVDLHFEGRERRVVLRQGQVLVKVASAPDRLPFVIQTPHGTAQALGTQYIVRQAAAHSVVTVLESTVRVCAGLTQDGAATVQAGAGPDCADASAGEQMQLAVGSGLGLPYRVDAEAEAAWQHGLLVADDRALTAVLSALGAQRAGLLRFDAQQLAGLRVSGVFALNDTDRALDVLQASLPIQVRRYTPWLAVVGRR